VSVSYGDVESASKRLYGVANRTPVVTSRSADAKVGARLFFKCEQFQRGGAFKFRGAYNAISRLPTEQRTRGVLAYSSGNHAQAVALACRELGIPGVIIMPDDAPEVKLRATRGYGAEVILYDRSVVTREDLAATVSAERGLPVIPPYDHEHVVAGQGTVALELIDDVPELDMLLVCCGGGGLLAGCAVAARYLIPRCKVVGVEPEQADDATRSFRTGVLHSVHNPDTIADGARTPSLGKITFPLVRKYVDSMETVSEQSIVSAMRFLWERMKLVVEPTGALAFAAAMDGSLNLSGKRVGIVLSGGNVDLAHAAALFERY
jgi:threo-3-hydroxy-L-aspartate ammonia-lyase